MQELYIYSNDSGYDEMSEPIYEVSHFVIVVLPSQRFDLFSSWVLPYRQILLLHSFLNLPLLCCRSPFLFCLFKFIIDVVFCCNKMVEKEQHMCFQVTLVVNSHGQWLKSYCHHLTSMVCCPSYVNFFVFIFSSETASSSGAKLYRK